MFVRVSDGFSCQLINTDHIALIEVLYAQGTNLISMHQALSIPDAVRIYKFQVGGQSYILRSDSNEPACRALGTIFEESGVGH